MSVLAQAAPYRLREGDWSTEGDRLGDLVVKTLERYAPGLGDLVTAREVITPADMERDYGLSGGHMYHAEHGMDSFFAWRPMLGHARYRFGLEGMYLAGSGAHPGGGVTGGPGGERRARDPARPPQAQLAGPRLSSAPPNPSRSVRGRADHLAPGRHEESSRTRRGRRSATCRSTSPRASSWRSSDPRAAARPPR